MLRLDELLAILNRGKKTIALSTLAILLVVVLYTFLTDPVFESTAMVAVDTRSEKRPQTTAEATGLTPTSKITNELEVLKSFSMSQTVAGQLLVLDSLGGVKGSLLPILKPTDADSDRHGRADWREVVKRLKKHVEFMPIRESDIIRITAESPSPEEAAAIANLYATLYSARNLEASRARSKAMREFLEAQATAKQRSLDSIEQSLQKYMRTAGVVSLDASATQLVEQLAEIEASRDAIELEIATKSKMLSGYKEELATQEPNALRAINASDDSYIKLFQEQLAQLEVQRDVIIAQNPELSSDRAYSDKLKELENQIASLRLTLQERTKDYVATVLPSVGPSADGQASFVGTLKEKIIQNQIELSALRARLESLDRVIALYEGRFNELPAKSMDLARLQRARLSREKTYLMVEEKSNEAAINEKSEFGYVTIIDPAVVPIEPVSPKVLLNLVLGTLVGAFLGVGFVLVRSSLDVRVHTPSDLRRNGFVPLTTVARFKIDDGNGQDRADKKRLDPSLVTHHLPFSPVSESYRHLRSSLDSTSNGGPLSTIMVTSPGVDEGKSTTAANLAISLTQTEKRVLLVDSDLRRPSIHKLFRLPQEPGLTEYLSSKSSLKEVLATNVLQNLDIMRCGRNPENPAELMASPKMKEFVHLIKGLYDVVIFDTPPLMAVTDPMGLANVVDGIVVVVSVGQTRIPTLERAVEQLRARGGNVLGVVLNKFEPRDALGEPYGVDGYGFYSANAKGYYQYLGPTQRRQKRT